MARTRKKLYIAGNWLRGFFEGKFSNPEEAWSYLSKRFLISYPVKPPSKGRHIYMYVVDINPYGLEQNILCKEDLTEKNTLRKEVVLKRCKRSLTAC